MTETIIIPQSLQITLDDVGWFNGPDDRKNGGSARTAMPRRHCAEDYAAINELGRRLDMRINCGFVLGEWDPDNRLRRVKYLSKFGDNWNNATYLGKEEMQAVADTVRSSPYIDIAVHGLLHNYYHPDHDYTNTDYYYHDGERHILTPEDEIRTRLDAYFDILDYYRIGKTPNSFIPPNFDYVWGSMTHILADYGIKYVSTVFTYPDLQTPDGFVKPQYGGVEGHGIITLNRNVNRISWREVGSDLDGLPPLAGIFGCHWPNLLHEDPKRNMETVDNWERYFKHCADTYGIILSKDIAFAAAQTLFSEYSNVSYDGGRMTVDITSVPKTDGRADRFYISARQEITAYSGCQIELHERRNGFINYAVTPLSSIMTFE
jgi:hypothetical protein